MRLHSLPKIINLDCSIYIYAALFVSAIKVKNSCCNAIVLKKRSKNKRNLLFRFNLTKFIYEKTNQSD